MLELGTDGNWLTTAHNKNLLGTASCNKVQKYDQQVQARIEVQWARIVTQLDIQDPKLIESFGGPLADSEIAKIQNGIGAKVPAQLKALWKINAKTGPFLSNYCFYNADEVLRNYWMYMDSSMFFVQYPISPDPANCDPFWHPGWIPIAGWDAFEILVNVETGEVADYRDPGTHVTAPSIEKWLQNVADRLEQNKVPEGYETRIDWIDSHFPTPGSEQPW